MGVMITTNDNPYDPRLDFPAWYAWDVSEGYNTTAYLARVMSVSDDMPEPVRQRQVEEAIDEIIREHAGGIYKKLVVYDQPA